MKVPTDGFLASVREALKHYGDARWLGGNSPLATPYFLGSHLKAAERPDRVTGRGEALRQVLFEAATAGWPGTMPESRQGLWDAVNVERSEMGNGGPCYLFLILDLRYLRRYYPPRTPPTAVGAIYDLLSISESAFFRHLNQAVERLVAALLRLVQPSLRLERPLLSAPLTGREALLAGCLAALQQRKSVSLSGAGGIGKSSLGTAVLDAWPENYAFWYTFRPGLNDELGSILFTLGHFLHDSGRSDLWLQLVASGGKVDSVEQALGLLREDLDQQEPASFLLCFDEVDLLQTGASRPRHGVHKLVLELLEGLCLLTPVLLIGQRALIDTEAHFALQPLAVEDVAAMMERAGSDAASLSPEAVHQATGGNPRLVELYLALVNANDQDMPLSLRRKPAMRPLFNRLWRRLSKDEKRALAGLSIYRSYAPHDIWEGHAGLAGLSRRHLIKSDALGGIALLPAFRQLVYDELPLEQRQLYHRQAADVRAGLAQYTSAAHHFCRADEVEMAVKLWFTVQDEEIAQGNAGAAYAVFNDVPPERVMGEHGKQLRVIQNRLYLLFGELESVLEGMDSYSWHVDEELSATALEQWGEAHRLLGDLDAARARYDEAIDILGRLSNQTVNFHVKRGLTFSLEARHAEAGREAKLAQYQVDVYQAVIENGRGQYRQARDFLTSALELARSVKDERREARANYLLTVATGNLGDVTTAHEYAETAMAYYKRVGNRLRLEGLRAELAGIYLNVGRFAEVIEPAEQALRFFEGIKHSHWPGHISSNLAEAYFETGDLEKAEQYARKAMATENPPVQPYALYTIAQVFQTKGDLSGASQAFQMGLQWAERNEDSFIAAYLHRVYGSFLVDQGQTDDGVAELARALDLFMRLGIPLEEEKTRRLLE